MPKPSFETSQPDSDQERSVEEREAEPVTREQLRDEYVELEERTRDLSEEEILEDPELRGELAAFYDKCEGLPSPDKAGLLLTDSGDPERFLEIYGAAAKASVHEYRSSLGLSAKAGFVEISRESPTAPEVLFDAVIQKKTDELIPPPDQAPEGVSVFETRGLRVAFEATEKVLEDFHRSYAVEIEAEGTGEKHTFIMPRKGELLGLGSASSLGTRPIRWERPSKEGKTEVLEFDYNPNDGLLRLERDGEVVLDPDEANKEFAAFRDRLLEYQPNPVSTEESVQRWAQRFEAMTSEEQAKFLTKLSSRVAAKSGDRVNRR